MRLTNHFVDNWKLRVSNGVEPAVEAVMGVMSGAIKIQNGRVFSLANGEKYKTLSLYWNPDLKIVVHVDPETGCAVTVTTDTMMDGKDTRRKKVNRNAVVPGYVAMTAHGLNSF